ncbi:MAG: hypothetical protein AAFS02_07695 [Pseudomonadota bacterium]
MLGGISIEGMIAYVAWLLVGFYVLARLARTRTQNPSQTMVLGTLALLIPPLGALVLFYLAFRPRLDGANGTATTGS